MTWRSVTFEEVLLGASVFWKGVTRTTLSQQLPKDYEGKLVIFCTYCKNKITEKNMWPEHITNINSNLPYSAKNTVSSDLVLIFVSRKRTSTPGSKGALIKCAELIGNPNLCYSSYWLNLIIRWSEAVTCVCTQYLHIKTFSLLKLHFSFNMLIILAASFISLIKNIYSLLAKAHTEKLCSSTLYHCKDKRLDVKTFYRLSDVMRGNRTFLIRVKL